MVRELLLAAAVLLVLGAFAADVAGAGAAGASVAAGASSKASVISSSLRGRWRGKYQLWHKGWRRVEDMQNCLLQHAVFTSITQAC